MKVFKGSGYVSGLLKKWGNWKLTSANGSGLGTFYLASRSNNGLFEETAIRWLTLSQKDTEMSGEGFQETLEQMKADIKMTKMFQNLPNLVSYIEAAMFPKDNGAKMDILLRMEQIESLNSLVQAKSLSADSAVRVGLDVSNALDLLEGLEILHLNLQPNSVVIDHSGQFKLLPPPLHGEQADPEQIRFMAPELRAYGTKSPKADQYSLGLILYWMLNDFDLPADILNGAAAGRQPPRNADARLAAIVLRACSISPSARFSSAKELHQALLEYARHDQTEYAAPSVPSEPENDYTVPVRAMVLDERPPEREVPPIVPKPGEEVPKPREKVPEPDVTYSFTVPVTVAVPAMSRKDTPQEREIPPAAPKPAVDSTAPLPELGEIPAKAGEKGSKGSKKLLLIPIVAAFLLIVGAGLYFFLGRSASSPVSATERPEVRVTETRPTVNDLRILSQPVDYVGAPGDPFTFSVAVEGEGVSYRWQSWNGVDWIDAEVNGSTTATISGKILGELIGTQYRCCVTDENGTVLYSSAAALRTDAVHYVIAQPADTLSGIGKPFELSVQAVGVREYQWEYLRNTKWEAAELDGSDSAVISGTAAEELLGMLFRCKMTGEDGRIYYSDEAALLDASDVMFRMQPMSHIGELGEDFAFAVKAPDAGSFEWQYLDGTEWKTAELTGSDTDTLAGVITEGLLGKAFRCVVTDAEGKAHPSREVMLSVSFAILQQPEKKFVGDLGSTFTFRVVAVGAQSYQWQYRSGGVWTDATNLEGNQTDTASGQIIKARVGVLYRCKIIDNEGNEHYSDEVLLWSETADEGGGSGGSSGGGSGGGSGGSSGGDAGPGTVRLRLGGGEFDSDVTSLNLQKKNITDISVLAQCTELTWLNLNNNQISDLTPLKNLKKLESLFLNNNKITDISALAGLTNLKTLQLQMNDITDWSPVDFLKNVAGRP